METNNARYAHLDDIEQRIIVQFAGRVLIHRIHYVVFDKPRLTVFVFFLTHEDWERSLADGTAAAIQQAFLDELGAVGRGPGHGEVVFFEFDSDENVKRNYRGNYFFRLKA